VWLAKRAEVDVVKINHLPSHSLKKDQTCIEKQAPTKIKNM
jgi:hypothetical protein